MVGPVVPEHLAPPGESLVRFVPVHDHAQLPGAQSLKCRIEFAVLECLFKVQVAFHRVDCGRGVGLGRGVRLRDRHRMFQTDGKRQPLQNTGGGIPARLLDVGIDLHCLAVLCRAIAVTSLLSGVGTVRHQHLLHEVGVRQQFLDESRLLFSLLSELCQAARRGVEQDDVFCEPGIQRVTGQELIQRIGLCLIVLRYPGGEFGTKPLELIGIPRLEFPASLGERCLRHRLLCPDVRGPNRQCDQCPTDDCRRIRSHRFVSLFFSRLMT